MRPRFFQYDAAQEEPVILRGVSQYPHPFTVSGEVEQYAQSGSLCVLNQDQCVEDFQQKNAADAGNVRERVSRSRRVVD